MRTLPRSVLFARNIALGALVATATACTTSTQASDAPAGIDAPPLDTPVASSDTPADAGAPDVSTVDGPLHPPNLPRWVRA